MYIRNRQDALDVLGEILDLPGRTEQIIGLTVKIMLCLDADPRMFLADCQAALIEGGLEEMRRRRRDSMAELEAGDLILILDPEEDALFEEVASTRDALRIADIVREVFPEISRDYPRWILARSVLRNEKTLQESIRSALRCRGESADPLERSTALASAQEIVRSSQPAWAPRSASIRQACLDVLRGAGLAPEKEIPDLAEFLFTVVAIRDERAVPFLEWVQKDPQSAVDFVGRLHDLRNALHSMEQSETPTPSSSELRRRIA